MATRKHKSPLEKFNLYFEKLPSDDELERHMKSYKKSRRKRHESSISR